MFRHVLLFPLVLFFSLQSESKPQKVCDHIHVMDHSLKLNNNEKILVCGSREKSEAWDEVPIGQAEFHLKAILQNLGYLEPRFERIENRLQVWMGDRTKIKTLVVTEGDHVLIAKKKRKVVKEALTSTKLNEVEAWANIETQSRGYACVENKVEAQAWDGKVLVQSNLNGRKKFGPVRVTDLGGLDEDVLERYQPFVEGEWYDIRKTQIMASRILSEGLFQSAYFITKCEREIAQVTLDTSVGKPRILTFGIGASTEELPFTDVTFKNARLDEKASSYTVNLHASPRELSLSLDSELYVFPGWNRTYLGPRFKIEKEIERAHETDSARAGVDIGRNWDLWDVRFSGRWGPTINYSKTIRGVGPDNITYPTIEGSLTAMSHVYEYLLREQYEGWNFQFFYKGQNKGLGSPIDVNRYQTNLKVLWNLGGFSPPKFVLGTRLETTVVDADNLTDTRNRELLPTEYRIYLGGDDDLRGFPRQSLDNQELGYLTSAYLGLELRLIEELPYKIQPFFLWDLAKLGNRRYRLDSPVYISEGMGVRWASPFGTLRGSAAKGRIWNQDDTSREYAENWVFFFSFGQEF